MTGKIPNDLEESVNDAVGLRYNEAMKRLMKLEVKAEKWENRVVALTEHRVFILSAKVPAKIETNIPFLDIQAIESRRPNQLLVQTDSKRVSLTSADGEGVDQLIVFIGTAIASSLFGTSLERVIARVELQPADRRLQIQEAILMKSPKEAGPCGGFTAAYAAMCDYHAVPYMEDVAWDVDTIYLSHDTRELNLADFDHLVDSRHLVPIIAALEYNTWFTKLNCSNVRLSSEAANEILRVMKRNTTLQQLWLSGMGIKWDFVQKLSTALLSNPASPLSHIDLSNNSIEDRGLSHLSQSVGKLSSGLVHLNLSRTGVSGKGVNRLAEALSANRTIPKTLQTLNLSHNPLKSEDLQNLWMFLSQQNLLTTLDLSCCDCALDSIFGHLLKGCCAALETIELSGNVFTHKRTKEGIVPLSWKQFFANAHALKRVNMSSCKLPADAVKSLLLGLASNTQLRNVEVDLSANDLRAQGAQVLENCVPTLPCVSSLNIAENNFDLDIPKLCQAFSRNKTLKKLYLGKNFNNLKPKHIPVVLGAVVALVQEDEAALESLSLADSRLRTDTTLFINALGSNASLTDVDISGNLMGDIGARMLAKALMINTRLRSIHWDRNAVTAQGFQDVAAALQKNFVMQTMPTPLSDAMAASRLNPEKTEAALQTIENVLQRNHSPRKLATDQAYRLHQGFLISSSQQMLSRLVGQVEEQLRRLEQGAAPPAAARADIARAASLVGDAKKSKLVLGKLQEVIQRSEGDSTAVDSRLKDITTDLHTLINNTVQKNTSDMLKCAEDQCPAVLEDKTVQNEIRASCDEKARLDPTFTEALLMRSVRSDVQNKISELNVAVAACMTDRLIDNVLDSLDECHKKLINHVNTKLSSPSDDALTSVAPPPRGELSQDNGAVIQQEESAQSTLKRKSLYSRRLRPQSVIDGNEVKRALVMSDATLGASTTDAEVVREEEEEHAAGDCSNAPASRSPPKPARSVRRSVSASAGADADVVAPRPGFADDSGISTNRESPEKTQYDVETAKVTSMNRMSRSSMQGELKKRLSTKDRPAPQPPVQSSAKAPAPGPVLTPPQRQASVESAAKSAKDETCDTAAAKPSPVPAARKSKNKDQKADGKTDATTTVSATEKDTNKKERSESPKDEQRERKASFKESLERKLSRGNKATQESAEASLYSFVLCAQTTVVPHGVAPLSHRASLPSRPPRPACEPGRTDEDDGSNISVGTKGSLDLPALSPIPQSPLSPISGATTPSSIDLSSPASSKAKTPTSPVVELPKLETEHKLEHLGKDRPRRPKTHAVTRNAVKSGGVALERSIEDEDALVDDGVGAFFSAPRVSKEHVVPEKGPASQQPPQPDRVTQRENEINREKSEEPSKKKGWSPFGGKPDKLAAGIHNFFHKKDKTSPTSAKGPEVTGRKPASPEVRRTELGGAKTSKTPETDKRPSPALRKSPPKEEEEEKKEKSEDELEEESPSRRPAGVPRFGLPGMGSGTSALLAEMRQKKAAKPADEKKDENKENQGVPAPRPVSSILRPKPAPRSASPNTQKDAKKSLSAGEKIEDVAGVRTSKPAPAPRPKPPPVAPKPRSSAAPKPVPAGVASSAASNRNSVSTSPATRVQSGLGGRMSESIDKDQLPPDQPPESPPPERAQSKQRRLSIKDRIAALPLEANNNTTPASSASDADNTTGGKKSATLPPMSSTKLTDVPPRALSGSDADKTSSSSKNGKVEPDSSNKSPTSVASSPTPANQKSDAAGKGDAPANGSSPRVTEKQEEEFVVFI